ncbi:aspartyl/asparaginyl beta-hydroxylase domain-containing protein [Sphingomonas sp. Y38-1Y]|uniref:aspartyl/asparaginyl beta-hydroxylase domain-containing protein n=1 Tax=Sphingomonas sp. Y38-1Y TaxID=3078265 RepID=UPI0028E8F2AE|nr:aspartyl/asparaginyl beta-hydroxylase domain-containing protein [Sphingomonas sp. Y38-1Y]
MRLAELHERRSETALAILRWSNVLDLARGIDNPAPGFRAVLDHARDYVSAKGAQIASTIEAGIADVREPLPRRDRRRFDACIDRMFGRRQIYQNECHGLHFPFLPADEFFDRELFPWMAALEAHTPAIRAEAEALLRDGVVGIVPYVAQDRGTPENKWSPLDRSFDWSVFYLWRFGARDDDHCRRCPATTGALEETVPLAQMGRRTPNVFFSILKPHTRLPAHTGVSNARAIVHLPLIVPPSCGFRVGGETREWREGEAFAFDDTIEHEAWNDSDQPRVVLILDVWNPHLTGIERDLLTRYFDVADASGFDPAALASVAD